MSHSPQSPQIQELFRVSASQGASDLHAQGIPGGGARLWLRQHGELVDGADLLASCGGAATASALHHWISGLLESSERDIDFSFAIEGSSRFRAHLYRMSQTWGAVFRTIPVQLPTLKTLGLPEILERIPRLSRGLVLVTGATGSGKSSTLAALLHEINQQHTGHIVTIEDPIEFVHSPLRCRLSQREVGSDTPGFADALRSALREDPDVILVGEMRDPETVSVALKAAETGHLVFSTVHTQDAARTVGRLIALFPPEEQRLVRLRLADNLSAIVSQRLVAKKGGGRVAAMEIVMATQSVRDCIENPERTEEMIEMVQTSGDGQGFDRHLVELFLAGQISLETARDSATRPADLERELRFGKSGSSGKISADDRAALEERVEISGQESQQDQSQSPDPVEEGAKPKSPFDSLKLKTRKS